MSKEGNILFGFFPLALDFFTNYKIKKLRKLAENEHEAIVVLLSAWSWMQAKGGYLNYRDQDLIEFFAEDVCGMSIDKCLKYLLLINDRKLIVDQPEGYSNGEISDRVKSLNDWRKKSSEGGKKSGLTRRKQVEPPSQMVEPKTNQVEGSLKGVEGSRRDKIRVEENEIVNPDKDSSIEYSLPTTSTTNSQRGLWPRFRLRFEFDELAPGEQPEAEKILKALNQPERRACFEKLAVKWKADAYQKINQLETLRVLLEKIKYDVKHTDEEELNDLEDDA